MYPPTQRRWSTCVIGTASNQLDISHPKPTRRCTPEPRQDGASVNLDRISGTVASTYLWNANCLSLLRPDVRVYTFRNATSYEVLNLVDIKLKLFLFSGMGVRKFGISIPQPSGHTEDFLLLLRQPILAMLHGKDEPRLVVVGQRKFDLSGVSRGGCPPTFLGRFSLH